MRRRRSRESNNPLRFPVRFRGFSYFFRKVGLHIYTTSYTRAISERFRDNELMYETLYNFSCLDLLYFTLRTLRCYKPTVKKQKISGSPHTAAFHFCYNRIFINTSFDTFK